MRFGSRGVLSLIDFQPSATMLSHAPGRPPLPDHPDPAARSGRSPPTPSPRSWRPQAHSLSRHRRPDGPAGADPRRGRIGYILEDGFDLPPLMLTADEIEAAVLGAQWVAARGDPALARAAQDLIAKIGAVRAGPSCPLRCRAARRAASPQRAGDGRASTWPACAGAIAGRKIELTYRDEQAARGPSGRLAVRWSATTRPARPDRLVRAAPRTSAASAWIGCSAPSCWRSGCRPGRASSGGSG